jgi:hypothetical protein
VIRPVLSIAVLAACAGCSRSAAIDLELVCSVTASPAYSRVPEGAAAWDWPAAARAQIERPGWTEAQEKLIRSCGSGMQPAVVRVAFSADRKLALITRSSFERGGPPEPDPEIQSALELTGAIESCLLRRERVLSTEVWQPVACKLDAVS